MTNQCLPGSQSACDCLGTCNTSNWLFHNCPALAIATPMISGFPTNVVTPVRPPIAVAQPAPLVSVSNVVTHTTVPNLVQPGTPVAAPLVQTAVPPIVQTVQHPGYVSPGSPKMVYHKMEPRSTVVRQNQQIGHDVTTHRRYQYDRFGNLLGEQQVQTQTPVIG